jgi:hypothetical protein
MDATTFGAMLLTGANGALPYIAGGVAAGAVLLAVGLGIGKGLGALRKVGGK